MQGSEGPDTAFGIVLREQSFIFDAFEAFLMLTTVIAFAAATLFAYGYLKTFLDYRLSSDSSRHRTEPVVQKQRFPSEDSSYRLTQ